VDTLTRETIIPTTSLARTIAVYVVCFLSALMWSVVFGIGVGVAAYHGVGWVVSCLVLGLPLPLYLGLFHPGPGKLFDRLVFRSCRKTFSTW
jgi:hypothetical protein